MLYKTTVLYGHVVIQPCYTYKNCTEFKSTLMGHDMICWSRFLPQSISSLLHLLFSLVDRAQDSCISPTSFIIQVVYEKGGLHLLFYLEYSLVRKKYALYWQLFEFACFPCKRSPVQTLPNLCYGPKKLKNST